MGYSNTPISKSKDTRDQEEHPCDLGWYQADQGGRHKNEAKNQGGPIPNDITQSSQQNFTENTQTPNRR